MKGSELFHYAETHGFGELHININPDVHLHQVVAIHSTKNGPALGGCRCVPYASAMDAINDAMRLARSMSFKAAMVDIPFGGGKTVLIRPAEIPDRQAYFKSVGHFIHQLNGRYITAIDSGTTISDMDIIRTVTPYVTCSSETDGETSLYTAQGVFNGLMAAVEYKLKRDSVEGLHVVIQGVGQVGSELARILHQHGAKLTVSDINEAKVQQCVEKFDAKIIAPASLYDVECDVFSPCALGAILNPETIPQIKASIIAGSANNQLAHSQQGRLLLEQNILYCPDYLINAGGLIYAGGRYLDHPIEQINQKLLSIHDTLLDVFERSAKENTPSNEIADAIAMEKL